MVSLFSAQHTMQATRRSYESKFAFDLLEDCSKQLFCTS